MELSKVFCFCDFGGGDVFWVGFWEGVEGGGVGVLGGGGIKDEFVGKNGINKLCVNS